MKTHYIFILLITAALFSCAKKHNSPLKQFLNTSKLESQVFEIDQEKDTQLVSKAGCIIRIPAGSLFCNINPIRLEIKEALSMKDIINGGLTTTSGNKILSSAGMLYLNGAKGYDLTIKKSLRVSVPTRNFNPDMKIFKGQEKSDGDIDWKDPVALAPDSISKLIDFGQSLFSTNCANCHRIDSDFTGPSLLGITNRRSKKWLYDFTRDPKNSVLRTVNDTSGGDQPDYYASCLLKKWQPVVMTSFPLLSDTALNAIFTYIETETNKHAIIDKSPISVSCEECEKNCREENVKSLGLMKAEISKSDPDTIDNSQVAIAVQSYNFNISNPGWYNVDIFFENMPGTAEVDLLATTASEYDAIEVALIIPANKVFSYGIKDETNFTFYDRKT
ncbi:MAG: cytochrome c, partial [Chryseobacterium sp.]